MGAALTYARRYALFTLADKRFQCPLLGAKRT
jgi:hypothetical protein